MKIAKRLTLPTNRVAQIALALGALALAVFIIGGILCKFVFYCHIHGAGSPQPLSKLVLEGRGATALPQGFHQSVVVSGLVYPTDFVFLPDGRILVTEKNGLIRVVRNGHILPAPFLDLRRRVAIQYFRGLLAVQVDPKFRENGYVYVLYVQHVPPGKLKAPPTSMRLIRVVARGDKAVPGSERIILGAAGRGSSCSLLPATTDCVPSDLDHDGGDIEFAKDGTMFVSTGDGGGYDEKVEVTALRAQSVDSLAGKVLHITRDGKGLAGNPFWNGDPNANRSKVWAYGLRNPFRLTLRPKSGDPYVGDVGATSHDEIDFAQRGANLGWPCYEGPGRHGLYAHTQVCKALYAKGEAAVKQPTLAFKRQDDLSVTGGVFYTGKGFPKDYVDAYFFGDWALSTLHAARFGAKGDAVGQPTKFAERAGGPVKLEFGENGDLYYLALNVGQIRRISYAP